MIERPYNFEDEMEVLRNLLNAADARVYRKPEFERDIRPLVICLNTWLIDYGIAIREDRDIMRHTMMSDMTGRHIESTYDLSKAECNTIYHFLVNDDYQLTRRASRFLTDLAKTIEGVSIY